MLFTPMLPEVAAGSIEARDIMQPLRAAVHRGTNGTGSSDFELGEAIGVDLGARTVTIRHPITHDSKCIEYDELVLALGATDSTMGVPGVEKFAVPLKTIADAEIVRSRVVGALEVSGENTAICWSAIGSCALSSSEETLPASNWQASSRRFSVRFCATIRASIRSRSNSLFWNPARSLLGHLPENLESTRPQC